MTRPPTIKKRTSSGGVIYRSAAGRTKNKSADNIEVVLVSVRGGKAWCLPKGIIDKGEDPPAAALREVREETGLTGEIVDRLGKISYWYFLKEEQVRIHKTVHFYLLKYVEGDTEDHDHEVDEARWFLISDALNQLSYKSEKGIMGRAIEMIADFEKFRQTPKRQSGNNQ